MGYITVNQATGRITLGMPTPKLGKAMKIGNVTLSIMRDGTKSYIAKYPSVYGESGTIDFLIDDDFVGAKAGWYIGVVKQCDKVLKTTRIKLERDMLGDFGVIDLTQWDDGCDKEPPCPTECQQCPPDPCCNKQENTSCS